MSLRTLLAQSSWAERRASTPWLVGLTTFGILALELALIRWTSSQVRVFAYFNNLVLIGAFLGMGLGVALGRRHPGLVHLTLPMLLLVSIPLAFSEPLGLVHLTFPDQAVSLWGGTRVDANVGLFLGNLALFLGLFTAMVATFVCAGAPLGFLFSRLPVLRAYTADLMGSLLGILAFAAVSWLGMGPGVWLALAALPFVWVSRSAFAAVLAAGAVGLGIYSGNGAVFSAYNRIDLRQEALWQELQVNRDFHQYLHDFSARRMSNPAMPAPDRAMLEKVRDLYDVPFVVNARRGSALVVGAGTGNDAQAALRNGYQSVTSVDIDRRILAIGRERHPEQPYANPAVRLVVDDARSFFGKETHATFDVVSFGLLDSHAMSSAMSTLRLDNYVYTEEGIRAAWQRVGPGGHLSLAISCTLGRWFFDRLYWTITRATGREPIALYSPLHGSTATFLVPREDATLNPAELARHPQPRPLSPAENVLSPSDDWPFLYVRPGVFPWGYAAVLTYVLLLAAVVVPRTFAMGKAGGEFDGPLFLMGAAFLLIETRGVTSMSLLFGSTWVVNAAIFAGIVFMVLVANLAVERWQLRDPMPWFWALFATVALLCAFPVAWLQTLPFGGRAILAGLITALPMGFAGLIVPMLLSRSRQPVAALGSNLLGAVLGGCLEYYSMVGGLRTTAIMALLLYLGAFLMLRQKRRALAGAPLELVNQPA
jgi:SAM-dependent methyltransferase